jgi:hypothetical protein
MIYAIQMHEGNMPSFLIFISDKTTTTVDTFFGIPYAEPPVGELRFEVGKLELPLQV